MTKDEIKKWLKVTGKDRGWLAEKCYVGIATVNSWLSTDRGIPAKAIIIIQNLMESRTAQPHPISRPIVNNMVAFAVAMTPDEARIIDAAAAALGITPEEFIRKAAVEDAEEFEKNEEALKSSDNALNSSTHTI